MHFRHDGKVVSARGVRIWISGPRYSRGMPDKEDVAQMTSLHAGTWKVAPKKIAGYHIPEPKTVTLVTGAVVEVTFDLERDDG